MSESPGNRVTQRMYFFCFLYPEKKILFEIVEKDSTCEESTTVLGHSPHRLRPVSAWIFARFPASLASDTDQKLC